MWIKERLDNSAVTHSWAFVCQVADALLRSNGKFHRDNPTGLEYREMDTETGQTYRQIEEATVFDVPSRCHCETRHKGYWAELFLSGTLPDRVSLRTANRYHSGIVKRLSLAYLPQGHI
jgi:hypothetical protein